MRKPIIMSHNYAYVANPGGVADVANNLADAFRRNISDFEEALPSSAHTRSRTLRRFSEEIVLEMRHYREDAILFFPNYFTAPLPGSSTRNVVLVHDLQHRSYPQFHSRAKRLLLESSLRIARSRAAGIVFISESTKRDFLRYFGEPRKYCVILNPVAVETSPIDQAILTAIDSQPYAIANFHSYPHKNIEKALLFFKEIKRQVPELKLVLTGRHASMNDLLQRSGLPEQSVVSTGFIPKRMVLELVANAEFFISLSLFEGFNMAAAEAAKLGRPLLLSNIEVHRELFGNYAYLANPNSTEPAVDDFRNYLSNFASKGKWEFANVTEPDVVAERYVRFFDEVRHG